MVSAVKFRVGWVLIIQTLFTAELRALWVISLAGIAAFGGLQALPTSVIAALALLIVMTKSPLMSPLNNSPASGRSCDLKALIKG